MDRRLCTLGAVATLALTACGGGSDANPPLASRPLAQACAAYASAALPHGAKVTRTELRKAEARHADLLKEYNDGAPVRNALELRNPQLYMERTAELKASVARSESDLAGIRRELARVAPSSGAK